jgi:hypothetical protein
VSQLVFKLLVGNYNNYQLSEIPDSENETEYSILQETELNGQTESPKDKSSNNLKCPEFTSKPKKRKIADDEDFYRKRIETIVRSRAREPDLTFQRKEATDNKTQEYRPVEKKFSELVYTFRCEKSKQESQTLMKKNSEVCFGFDSQNV